MAWRGHGRWRDGAIGGLVALLVLFQGIACAVELPLLVTQAKWWVVADPAAASDLDDRNLPPAQAAWRTVTLPHQWSRRHAERPGIGWYRIDFDLTAPVPADAALYLSRLSIGGNFYVNGTAITAMRATDAATQVRWRRPHLIAIPAGLLQAGSNNLLVRIVTRDDLTIFPQLKISTAGDLRPEFDRRYVAEYSSAQFSAFAAAIIAVFMLVIWGYRRSEQLYLFFGLTCLFWSLRTQIYLVEAVPWAWWWPWRILYSAMTGCFALSVAAFFLSYIGQLVQRWRWALFAWALVGPLALLVSNGAWQTFVNTYWTGSLFLLELFVLWRFFQWTRRHPSLEAFGLAGAALATFLLAGNDYAVRSGWMPYSNAYAMHLGAPVVMLAMGALLAKRFVRALGLVELANQELARKVQEKEQELSTQYERTRAVERNQELAAERQRIMQDMHDGLGSQLLTSLAAVERGTMGAQGMAQVLRDAMDDMRLAIDTLSPGREGMLEALGNLRYRLEPRFRAAGIALRFAWQDMPEQLHIAEQDALQILRVLQESLSNVLKHAHARQVEVELSMHLAPARFRMVISDDGGGFDTAVPARAGRGLSGMRHRAQRIGAELEIRSTDRGTHITLVYPLDRAH